MSIDKLNSVASLIAVLREGSGGKIDRARSKPLGAAGEEAKIVKRADVKELRQQLADLAKNISIEDKAAVESIRPLVIRSILLWKYGPELREHSEWQPMLQAIDQAIEKHPANQENFLKLLQDLKR